MPGERLSDRLVQGTVKFGGGSLMIWGYMSWEGSGYTTKIDGRMDADLFVSILDDELQQSIRYYKKSSQMSFFSRTITPNTRARRPKTGSKTVDWKLWSGPLNQQTLIQLKTFGITSRLNLESLIGQHLELQSYGREYRRSGMIFQHLSVKI